MKTIKLLATIMLSLLLLAGCTQKISDIKSTEYVGKTVTVSGVAENPIKLGKISGYTVVDNNGDKVGVSSEDLPSAGDKVTVKGTLMKDTLLGYYILVK